MFTFTYEFEELPIVVEGGFEAGLINGSALISVHSPDEFYIRKVFLEGYRKHPNGVGFENRPVELERNSWLFIAICERLEEGRFEGYIERAIAKEIQALGDDAADRRREHMREEI